MTSAMATAVLRPVADVSFTIKRAHDIPAYCTRLASMLAEKPLFDGRYHVKVCKVISLDSFDDARICDIFNSNARKIDNTSWHIHDFGCCNNQIKNRDHHWISPGVSLRLYGKHEMCSLEVLEASYYRVFESMTTGWFGAKLIDNPGIMDKEDPEEFALFIKDIGLIEEDTLIRFIARSVSLEDNVKCGSSWRYNNGKIYLWIRKAALEVVVNKFGFVLHDEIISSTGTPTVTSVYTKMLKNIKELKI